MEKGKEVYDLEAKTTKENANDMKPPTVPAWLAIDTQQPQTDKLGKLFNGIPNIETPKAGEV